MPIDENQLQDGEELTVDGRPEAVQQERNVPFLGLTRHNHPNVELPDDVFGHDSSIRWWAEDRWHESGDGWVGDGNELPENLNGFSTVIRDLPRAQLAEAAWIHPQTGEVVKTGKHNAVINPAVAENIDRATDEEAGFEFGDSPVGSVEEAREHWGDQWRSRVVGDDALYQIPTDDYTVVNPMEFLEPLARVARDRDLGDAMFGEFRLFRGGGKVSADVLFNGEHVDVPGRNGKKPIVVGFQVDYDHFGGTSISAQGMAMNWECVNAFRAITDSVSIKHTGDMDEREFTVGGKKVGNWHGVWEEMFRLLEQKKDMLSELIAAAMEMNLTDVLDLPDDFGSEYRNKSGIDHPQLFALYKLAGYPDYLAKEAARDAHANALDTSDPTWWDLHNGATYAVSHFSLADVAGGSQVEDHMRLANDFLMNPANVAEEVNRVWVERQEADDGDDGRLAGEGGGRAQLVKEEDLTRAREMHDERQAAMLALTAGDE